MDDRTQIVSARPLSVGHELLWFRIDNILGQGGFGMTYLATDTNLGRQVAIKEYLPGSFAFRDGDFTVKPLSADHEDNYSWGLESFQNEARTLARFKHRNIVQVHTVFEEHNTAYMVMEYEQGDSLSKIFRHRAGQLDQTFFEDILFPVIDGLQQIHDAGFIHRDIKPGNLMIRSDGSPVLIDFGSARQTSIQETGEMTTLVSQGYTPLEQYSANFGEQGPWTDIYALAASLYHGISGKRLVDALGRSASLLAAKSDPFNSLSAQVPPGFSLQFLSAVDNGLKLSPGDRPQSLGEWRARFDLTAKSTPGAPLPEDDATRFHSAPMHNAPVSATPDEWPEPQAGATATSVRSVVDKTSSKSVMPMIVGVAFLAVCVVGGWLFVQNGVDESFSLTEEMVSLLPKPAQAATIQTPLQRLGNEIEALQSLSVAYLDIQKIDGESAEAKEGLAYVVENYEALVESPLLRGSDLLREQIKAALTFLSASVPAATPVLSRLELAERSVMTFVELQPLLDKRVVDAQDRDALLLGLATLGSGELSGASGDEGVRKLLSRFTQLIFEACEQKDFQRAANTLELALLVGPDDKRLLMLQRHLESTGL